MGKTKEERVFFIEDPIHEETSPCEAVGSNLRNICFFLVIIITAFSITTIFLQGISDQTSNGVYRDAFEAFKIQFNKEYQSICDEKRAYEVFVMNILDIEEERRKQPNVLFALHPWMDVHPDQIKQEIGLLSDESFPFDLTNSPVFTEFDHPISRPSSLSLRDKCTPVKNQGNCGSCWAFSVVAAVETAHAKAGNSLISLSEQELVECNTSNRGCKGGDRSYAMSFVMQTGLVGDAKYPYSGVDGGQCKLPTNDTRVFIKDYRLLSKSEDTMADWLFNTGPMTIGMNVTKGLYSYRSGVFHPTEEDCHNKSEGSHAMTLVGYGTERGEDYWLVKNSWGDYWGDSGYFKLARGANVCGMGNHVVAPIYK